jgi:hypothetical protein
MAQPDVGSVSSFKSQFTKDLARANKFKVVMPIIESNNTPIFTCHIAQLPGKTFATMEQKTYGPLEKFPYLATYNDIDLTFYVDGNMTEKIFMDQWMNLVTNNTTNDIGYKSGYAKQIEIYQYDDALKEIYHVKLIDAYPISMNQLDLDWSAENFHSLSVTFAYTYWTN